MSHLYFSYGSNMDEASMRQRCPEAAYLGAGYLDNYQLVFTGFLAQRNRGGADILQQEGGQVWGLLYRLSNADLAKLDANKVYPTVYDRFPVRIIRQEGGTLENVWTYSLCDKTDLSPTPTQAYLDLLIGAAMQHDFPTSYLSHLQSFQVQTH
jgi:gamma-glutamylcyclotransferase (GGCT)/AIG2-like uncharacterized protein YtfP